jgi:hypothetical protein
MVGIPTIEFFAKYLILIKWSELASFVLIVEQTAFRGFEKANILYPVEELCDETAKTT